MRALLVILALLVPRVAAAGRTVGLLVTGEYLKAPTSEEGEKWLREHNQTVVTQPLPADAVKILSDCFVVDDPQCARSVVDARATTDGLISIRIEVTSKKSKEVRLTIDWFVKGHNPVTARRTCENCSENVLRSTVDSMLVDLAKTMPGYLGRIKVTSEPAGMTVLLDNATVGVTPIERDVTIGPHKVRLARDGRMGDESSVTVAAGATAEVKPAIPPEAPAGGDRPVVVTRRSRVVPGIMIGIGLAGIGAGTALYLTSEKPTGMDRRYRDTKTLGLAIGGGGAALALTGVIIILATGSSSGPTVTTTAGGATVGWIGRF